jgi:protein phosphatase
MNLQFFAGTDRSPVRAHNEDRFWLSPDGRACAVLDGCGMRGRAADVIVESLEGQRVSSFTSPDAVRAAVNEAEEAWLNAMQKQRELRGGGTTLDLLVVVDDGLLVAHVGDGRVYRVHGERVEQVSTDHTLVAELVARGELTTQEAPTHPHRNVITRALGGARYTEPEIIQLSLSSGDFVVACTDGIWHQLPASEFPTALRTMAPQHFVSWALRAATLDNGTIAVGVVVD